MCGVCVSVVCIYMVCCRGQGVCCRGQGMCMYMFFIPLFACEENEEKQAVFESLCLNI